MKNYILKFVLDQELDKQIINKYFRHSKNFSDLYQEVMLVIAELPDKKQAKLYRDNEDEMRLVVSSFLYKICRNLEKSNSSAFYRKFKQFSEKSVILKDVYYAD